MSSLVEPILSFCTLVLGVAIGFPYGMSIGHNEALTRERQKALEAGVGAYYVDKATGQTSFIYGNPK